MTISKNLENKYLYYWLLAFREDIIRLSSGGGQPNINQEKVSSLKISAPSKLEQQKIANFLDYETAKIDKLITKQERLIELLKEKRQAVISHAVTKGLNPNVKMKDSGVEWLGEVPEHWAVTALKFITDLNGRIGFRGYTTEDIVDEGCGAISMSPSNISDSFVNFEKSTYITWDKYYESPEIQIKNGDVVIVKTGSTLGKVGYIDNLTHPVTLNPQMAVFKNTSCCNKWLYYLFNSGYVKQYIDNSNSGGTVPTMSQEKILNYIVPIPPLKQQIDISVFLDAYVSRLNNLLEKVILSRLLLEERKTSLISAAVTGKIDLGDWKLPIETAQHG